MKSNKKLLVLLLSVLLLLALTACAAAEPEVSVSVTLVNRSGQDISSISITPSTSSEWDTEYVDGVFADGDSIEAGLGTYKESEVPDAYNILIAFQPISGFDPYMTQGAGTAKPYMLPPRVAAHGPRLGAVRDSQFPRGCA